MKCPITISFLMEKYRKLLLEHLSKKGEISTAEAAKIIGRSAKTARRILLELVDEHFVVATGANRNRKYRLKVDC